MPSPVSPFLRERNMNHEETGATWFNEVVASFQRLVRVPANFTIVPPDEGAEVAPYVIARAQNDHRHWVFHAARDSWFEAAVINQNFDLILPTLENNPYEPKPEAPKPELPEPEGVPRKSSWARLLDEK